MARASTAEFSESTRLKSELYEAFSAAEGAVASVATETRAGPFVLELERARSAISKAEEDLETAMGDLCVVPQGEKIGISVALEAVFFKLRSAKAELTRVEALIAEGLAKS